MRATFLLVLVAILATACANNKFHRAEVAKAAQTELVGMSRKDVLSCAGAPVREAKDGDIDFLTYIAGGDSTGAAVGVANSSRGVASVSSHRRYREVTFVLQGGVVSKVNYSGRTGGLATTGEQCALVVENCMPGHR